MLLRGGRPVRGAEIAKDRGRGRRRTDESGPCLSFAVFWIFAAILVIAASCVITVRNPVHSRCSWFLPSSPQRRCVMLLRAEFLAIALVLVYVGAVMVLFLFVVMMLDIKPRGLREGSGPIFLWGPRWGIAHGGRDGARFERPAISESRRFPAPGIPVRAPATHKNSVRVLLHRCHAYPLELAAVLLLVAIVVAIALTLRKRKDTKYQDPVRQVAVKRSDRVRLVSMPSEKND